MNRAVTSAFAADTPHHSVYPWGDPNEKEKNDQYPTEE